MLASLGCGNPTALADLKEGETVLDLGSGSGIDLLLSARRVDPAGKAYGLDMTDDVLALARENQRKARAENVEFLRARSSIMTRCEQNENVVRVQLDIDIAVPIGSARHRTVDPDVGNAMLAQGPQIALNERKPVAVCMCVLMKMSGCFEEIGMERGVQSLRACAGM